MSARTLAGPIALGLAFALTPGCQTPAEREAARKAWEQRDMERAAQCLREFDQWVAGTCVYGGASSR